MRFRLLELLLVGEKHKMKKLPTIIGLCALAVALRAAPIVHNLVFVFDDPTKQYPTNAVNYNQLTNIVCRIYSSQDLTNWTATVPPVTVASNSFLLLLPTTNDYSFYKVSLSNFWGETFSGVLGTPATLTGLSNLVLGHQ